MTRGSDSLELILDLSVFFCAAIGFGYGVIRTLVKKKALYAQMITGAVGCMMLGRLAQVVRALAGMESKYSFQLDLLGYVGVFLFLFCANAGVMDRIADDGTEKYLRYRWLALLAPLLVLGVYGLGTAKRTGCPLLLPDVGLPPGAGGAPELARTGPRTSPRSTPRSNVALPHFFLIPDGPSHQAGPNFFDTDSFETMLEFDIIDIEWDYGVGDNDDTFTLTVEYIVDGKTYIGQLNQSSGSYKVGKTIPVLYDPNDPSVVHGGDGIGIYFIVAGAVILAVIAVSAVQEKKQGTVHSWLLLGCVTFGINSVFWTNSYLESAHVVFYHDVKAWGMGKSLEEPKRQSEVFIYKPKPVSAGER